MDPDAMTTLLGDAIFNMEEEEYWEACQHALKDPSKARIDDEDDEEGEAPSKDNEVSDSKDSNSYDSDSKDSYSDDSEDNDGGDNDSEDSDCEGSDNEDYGIRDSGIDKGEPPSDREDEDAGTFCEDNSYDEVDYYDEDIANDVEAVGGDYD
ncbi:uncharacterized protein LOC126690069 [Quercus robur]|uniref:uncharacterized protein LOC126690069 n=1 Tax=Quercus robur TaxID=38942 RepID=UPI002162C4B5|nr:uncharacterized protein LOC126690069 [Quercus robur]